MTHLPVPGFLWPLFLTWGAAGAADLMFGLVVLLFLVSAALVLCVVWGYLREETEVGENYSGISWGGQTGSCPDFSSLPESTPTHLQEAPSPVVAGKLPGDHRGLV